MRLFYYRGRNGVANFGDELNPYLWSRLLPDLDRRGGPDWVFVGIGTLLNDRLPPASRTIVFGAGVGYGARIPTPDPTWRVHFVRGPRSAAALGLPSDAALTDPAILVATVWRERPAPRTSCAFMPHWENANGWIEGLCQDEGIDYIDPRWPVEKVLRSIVETRVLLAEAMHGAIVADALRVPWVPVRSASGVLSFKWLDWCDSIGSPYAPQTTLSLQEPSRERRLASTRTWVKAALLRRQLGRISRTGKRCLSSERTWQRLQAAVQQKLEEFRAETGEPGDGGRA